jgi:NAD(P)H-dependent FMN reductase
MLLICAASSGHNLLLARRLEALATEVGVEASVLDLTDTSLPVYTPREEARGVPQAVHTLAERFRGADALVVCAPEYNGSLPPCLVNTVAWLSRSGPDWRELFNGRPAVIATHSGGGGTKVLVAMRTQLAHLGCHVLGRELLTSSAKPLNLDGARAVLRDAARMSAL